MVISGIQFRAACHKAGKDTILGVVVHFTASFRWIAAHACCVPAAAPRHPVPESTAASSKVSALPADVSGRVQAFANGFGPFLQHTEVSVGKAATELPEDVQTLVRQFEVVFPDELPNHPPPSRTADHRIELEADSRPASRPC